MVQYSRASSLLAQHGPSYTEDSVFSSDAVLARVRGLQTVTNSAARKFSVALGLLYAAKTADELEHAVTEILGKLTPTLTPAEHRQWTAQLGNLSDSEGHRPRSCVKAAPVYLELLGVHVARCKQRLLIRGRSRTAKPPAETPSIKPLTAREVQVLQRVATGETDSKIGKVLGISTKTVSKHLEHILHKLGVETRTAAAARLHKQ